MSCPRSPGAPARPEPALSADTGADTESGRCASFVEVYREGSQRGPEAQGLTFCLRATDRGLDLKPRWRVPRTINAATVAAGSRPGVFAALLRSGVARGSEGCMPPLIRPDSESCQVGQGSCSVRIRNPCRRVSRRRIPTP